MHSHVFNANDLPVEGFLEHALGQPPWLAAIVADALELFTTDSTARSLERDLTEEELRDATRALLERHEAARAGAPAERSDAGDAEIMLRGLLDGPASLESDADRARFEELEAGLAGIEENAAARSLGGALDLVLCHVRWAYYLTHTTEWVGDRLVETYPEVELFTPLMMDLEPWFEGSPAPERELADQLTATRDLVLRHPGRIHPFASYDPRRQVRDGNALELVEAGLASGMIGVKIYPPLGYRPWGNAELPSTPADPRPADAASWDAALAELYDYCAANDVPIAAHCSNPGAEARPGRGLYADPASWRPVLERYRDRGTPLRVNFNHAGGLEELLERPEESWAWTLGRLIEDEGHELVFADLGHLDEVLRSEGRARLAEALGAYFERFPKVKQRLMFGTDWHMLVRRPGHEEYLHAQARFIEEFFPEMKADFLGQNALRYLGLEPGRANWSRLDAFYRSHGLDRPPWWIDPENTP